MDDIQRRNFTYADLETGEMVVVTITVDWSELAQQIGHRALRAKGKKAVSMYGAVKATAKADPK